MTPKQLTALLLLSALWGGSFIFIRVAAPVLGPVVLVELRVLIAGIALLIYALLLRRLPELRSRWKTFLVIGLFNSAVPFFLISTAELHLTASLAVTLNAVTPLFGALVAAFWLGEALTGRKASGLLLGLFGVAVLVGLGPIPLTPTVLLSIGVSLLATVSYGFAAVYTKVAAKGAQPPALALYSQLFTAGLLVPAVPFALPAAPPSGLVMLCVLGLGLFSTALAYLLYFYLIVSAGPTKATMVTYLSPAFGILWGALLLSEPLTVGSFAGFGLILASVWLVTTQAGRWAAGGS